jgi:pimeloyl-ACP methyl ester carboxylesterase
MRFPVALEIVVLSCFTLFGSNPPSFGQDSAKRIDGYWEGALKVGGIELQMGIHVKQDRKDISATLDIPLQAAKDLKLEDVALKDNQFTFQFRPGKGSFEGRLNEDATEISGRWKQNGRDLELIFKKKDKPTQFARPQEPKKPYPYREVEVIYENKQANVKLAGTLTLPQSAGPHPVVLLIAGSGPQDRNETIFGHKPFWIIADHLTRHGIAVLRVDKRGNGSSTGDYDTATSVDFADDVLAGIEFLKRHKELDPRKIGLLGHSEGGLVGPMVAARSKDIAFVVMLAGTALSGEEIFYLQGQAVRKVAGANEKTLAKHRIVQGLIFKIVKEEKNNAIAEKKIAEALDQERAKLAEDEKMEWDKQRAAMNSQIKQILNPWFRYFLTYDPRRALMKMQCPVLSLIGEKDLQVLPKENNAEIAKALSAGGNKDFTVKVLPGLNHLFQRCATGALSEYGSIEETMAPAVLNEVSAWILRHTR